MSHDNEMKIYRIKNSVNLACTKSYYFDVADDSRVCYVEKDF